MLTIAISGKGGTGKSTVTAFMIRWLSENVSKSILAVDADSNVNLNDLLGVPLKETIGSIREEMKSLVSNIPGGMSKPQFLEYKIQSSIVETPDFDLIAMGHPEGPGCYCYANNLLREILKSLSDNYEYVIIDNEAGMEHLSRRTTQNIDYLLMVSDPTVRGIRTAGRISRVANELEIRVGEKHVILNRVNGSVQPSIEEAIEAENLKLLGAIPEDKILLEMDTAGKPFWPTLAQSHAYKAMDDLLQKLHLTDLDKKEKIT